MLEGSSSRLNVHGLRRIAWSEEDHQLVEKLAPWFQLTTMIESLYFSSVVVSFAQENFSLSGYLA